MSTTTDIRHLTDAELVGILDGDAAAPDTERRAHLNECDRCADALDTLRTDSALVRDYLDLARFEEESPRRAGPQAQQPVAMPVARPNPWTSSWWKAAAILVLVAGPLAAFPGVRSWVAERVVGQPEQPVEREAAPLDASNTVLRFVPDPGNFVVDFELGTAGTIAIVRGNGPEAELRASDGAPETVVSASSLLIDNPNVSRYELRLPAGITGVWVRRGDRAVALTASQIDRRAVVQLTRTGAPATIRADDQEAW